MPPLSLIMAKGKLYKIKKYKNLESLIKII